MLSDHIIKLDKYKKGDSLKNKIATILTATHLAFALKKRDSIQVKKKKEDEV
jgi:hypothetical protein